MTMYPKMKALVAGSFDPIHKGHLDIITRAARMYNLTVLVANHPAKKYMFTIDQRLAMVQDCLLNIPGGKFVKVDMLAGNKLTADYAFENGIPVIVRGVRNFTDFDYEKMLREVNITQQNGVDTVIVCGDPKLGHVSSTAVKQLFEHAGFIHEYVPLSVKRMMERRAGVTIVGVTGNIASGKNWVCEKLYNSGPDVHHIDLDKLGHEILFSSNLPAHQNVRMAIRSEFRLDKLEDAPTRWEDPLCPEERKFLGDKVFADAGLREKLNALMYQPLMTALRYALNGKQGIVLVNAALLAEFKLTHICNNQVLLVTTTDELRLERMRKRGYTEEQIKHRLASQYTDERKRYHIEQAIKRDGFGQLIEVKSVPGEELSMNYLRDLVRTNFVI